MNSEYQDIRTQQIDSIVEANQKKFSEWLEGNPDAATWNMPEELSAVFVPRRVYELASNPENVKIFQLPKENRVRFLAYEKDYTAEQLTNPNDWKQWQEKKREMA